MLNKSYDTEPEPLFQQYRRAYWLRLSINGYRLSSLPGKLKSPILLPYSIFNSASVIHDLLGLLPKLWTSTNLAWPNYFHNTVQVEHHFTVFNAYDSWTVLLMSTSLIYKLKGICRIYLYLLLTILFHRARAAWEWVFCWKWKQSGAKYEASGNPS